MPILSTGSKIIIWKMRAIKLVSIALYVNILDNEIEVAVGWGNTHPTELSDTIK
jgi:hypothetical protein